MTGSNCDLPEIVDLKFPPKSMFRALCGKLTRLGCRRVHVEEEAVLVHEGRVLGSAHVSDRLRAHRRPVHRVVALPAAVRPGRLRERERERGMV